MSGMEHHEQRLRVDLVTRTDSVPAVNFAQAELDRPFKR